MEKEKLQKLLSRYLAGDCTAEEIRLLEQWFDNIADPSLGLSEPEKAGLQEKIRRDLYAKMARSRRPKVIALWPAVRSYGMAAAVVLMAVVAGWLLYDRWDLSGAGEQYAQASTEAVIHKNTSDTVARLHLPDGSTVLLHPGGNVAYDGQFGIDKRAVKLTGEAFFEVTKDAERPFYVYGGSVVTKVLGTSFLVKAPADAASIQVEVRTGKVSVYKKDGPRDVEAAPVVLTPNQKVTYFIEENHWVTGLVETPRAVQGGGFKSMLVFDNTPLPEIAERLEKNYNIEILIENEKVNTCTFTGDVSAMELYDMLHVITRSIAAEYEVQDTRIVIVGNGCN